MQEELEAAAGLLGDLSAHEGSRDAVREQGGIQELLSMLKKTTTGAKVAATALLTLTTLVTDSPANQDYVRQNSGLWPIVKFLDVRISPEAANAAVMCLTGKFLQHRLAYEGR